MHLTCPICFELFGASDESGVTECGHLFHITCAVPWITDNQNCPQCRQNCTPNLQRVYFTGTSNDNVHLNSNCKSNNNDNTNTTHIRTATNSNYSDNSIYNLITSFEQLESFSDDRLEPSDEIKCLKSDLQISENKIIELKSVIESLEEAVSNVTADRDELIKQIEISHNCSQHNFISLLNENKSLRATIQLLEEDRSYLDDVD